MHNRLVLLLLVWITLAPPASADQVPAYLLRIPASISTVFVADTAAAEFHRFDNDGGSIPRYVGKSYMSIGQNGDGKQKNGDQRTPLGAYFVTEQIDTERLHEKYGITAFPIDYPNAWDRRLERDGDGIWVHGVDRRSGKRPILDTDGCIALPNDVLSSWEQNFEPGLTPVVIARQIRWAEPQQLAELRQGLQFVVATWAGTLQRGELISHLALYDDEFRFMGLTADEWRTMQRDTLAARAIDSVRLSELLLLADPQEEGLYLSRFNLSLGERSGTITYTKRLYWRRTATGELKIVAEDAG